MLLETPEMLEALRAFCLDRWGPDEMRIETANYLCRKGVLPSGRMRMFVRGEWTDIEMFGFEISPEPVDADHSPQVDEWGYEAMEAI
jgi:hypothetical protein